MRKFIISLFLTILLTATGTYALEEVISKFDNRGLSILNEQLRHIKEVSTDGTLAGNSDEVVPTEKAVKTYVDAQIAAHVTTYHP